jgi:hypothetical protein
MELEPGNVPEGEVQPWPSRRFPLAAGRWIRQNEFLMDRCFGHVREAPDDHFGARRADET